MSKSEKSIGWVVTMSAIMIAVIGWCVLASAYASDTDTLLTDAGDVPIRVGARRTGVAMFFQFIKSGVTQIPNVFNVIGFAFRERFGLVVGIGVLELLVLLGGRQLKKFEDELNKGRGRR